MLKTSKKTWLIHGTSAAVMLVVCCFDIRFFLFWNLGYALYFTGKLLGVCVRELRPLSFRILTAILLAVVFAPGTVLLCLPGWFVCAVHQMKNPEYALELPTYSARGMTLRNSAFFRDYNSWLFEGEIDEESLKKAASAQNWNFKKITAPVTLTETARGRIRAHLAPAEPQKSLRINDGWLYSSYNGTDSGVFVVWERKTKRLYFSSTMR